MGLNKSKKLAKKSVKPVQEVEELDEIEELDEVEEVEEVPAPKAKRSKKAAKPAPMVEDEPDDSDDEISFDTDSVIKGIVSDKQNLTSAVYQVQLRLPAEIEPMYKAIPPRLKKALRDAFAELVRKAYNQTCR